MRRLTLSCKYKLEVRRVDKAIRTSKERTEALKGVMGAKMIARMKKEAVECPVLDKTVAFVDPASSSGYIYPMVLLIKQGLVRDRDPKSFFKDALFAGTHDAALRAVAQGRVDAAASFDKAPELHLKDPALVARLSFVGETPPIPEAGICARPGLPGPPLRRRTAFP